MHISTIFLAHLYLQVSESENRDGSKEAKGAISPMMLKSPFCLLHYIYIFIHQNGSIEKETNT